MNTFLITHDLARKTGGIVRPLSKGILVNPKLMKMLVKGALSLSVASLIGYTIKLEHKAEERIDEHFENKDN
jgi:hypothetical protein